MNGSHVSLSLAKEEYCARRAIYSSTDRDKVSLRICGRNEDQDYVFSVTAPFNGTQVNSIWPLERHDGLKDFKSPELTLPRESQRPTASTVCFRFQQQTGKVMRESDIATIVVEKDNVVVIFDPDSMTFKHQLLFKRI